MDSFETILEIPEFLKYLAMNILVGSWDDYRSLRNDFIYISSPSITDNEIKINELHKTILLILIKMASMMMTKIKVVYILTLNLVPVEYIFINLK